MSRSGDAWVPPTDPGLRESRGGSIIHMTRRRYQDAPEAGRYYGHHWSDHPPMGARVHAAPLAALPVHDGVDARLDHAPGCRRVRRATSAAHAFAQNAGRLGITRRPEPGYHGA